MGIARFFLCPDSDFKRNGIAGSAAVAHDCRKSEMSEYILETIEVFLRQLLPAMELDLFDIQFRREGHGWVLRVFIDADRGVTLEDCSKVSRELSHYLDIEDLIDHAYKLEVSSPGLERPLRSVADFARFMGKTARVKLSEKRDGQKIFEGIIEEIDGSDILLKLEDQSSVRFSFEVVNKARLTI